MLRQNHTDFFFSQQYNFREPTRPRLPVSQTNPGAWFRSVKTTFGMDTRRRKKEFTFQLWSSSHSFETLNGCVGSCYGPYVTTDRFLHTTSFVSSLHSPALDGCDWDKRPHIFMEFFVNSEMFLKTSQTILVQRRRLKPGISKTVSSQFSNSGVRMIS